MIVNGEEGIEKKASKNTNKGSYKIDKLEIKKSHIPMGALLYTVIITTTLIIITVKRKLSKMSQYFFTHASRVISKLMATAVLQHTLIKTTDLHQYQRSHKYRKLIVM